MVATFHSRTHFGHACARTISGEIVIPSRKRVLFVCLGNSCRSQMAEAFARAYGSDVLIAASAGLTPASGVAADTSRAMAEKGLGSARPFS